MFELKIGIIVYSQTGNTFSAVEQLQKKLSKNGHNAYIERLKPLNPDKIKPGTENIKYKEVPDLTKYEGYIFAGPVHALSISAGLQSYLNEIHSLDNKKTACLITKGLPFNWTGGNRALNQLKRLVKSKEGEYIAGGIINWMNYKRKKDIEKVTAKISSSF